MTYDVHMPREGTWLVGRKNGQGRQWMLTFKLSKLKHGDPCVAARAFISPDWWVRRLDTELETAWFDCCPSDDEFAKMPGPREHP